MSELIERIQVTETLTSNGNNHARAYSAMVEFKPFEKRWEITWQKLRSKTSGFMASLLNEIAKTFKMKRFFAGKDTIGFNWDSLGEVIGRRGGDDDDEAPAEMESVPKKQQQEDDEGIASEPEDDSSSDSSSDSQEQSSSDSDNESDGSKSSDSTEETSSGSDDEDGTSKKEKKDKRKKNDSQLKLKEGEVPKVALKKSKSSSKMDVSSTPTRTADDIARSALREEMSKKKNSEQALSFLMGQSSYITAYEFDEENHQFTFSLSVPADKSKLLLVSMIEKMAEKFVIREVSGIVKAAVLKPDQKNPVLRVQTAGINFAHIHRLSKFVDVDSISTNDVQAVYKTYGIEAAREALRGEISAVFQAYGITVNPRHLTLVADYMTHTGEIRAMTRNGISTSASPFLKMSFESTTRFLASTASRGDYENMLGPSAAIVLGLAPRVGSGLCDIRHNFAFDGEVTEAY